MQRLGDAAAFGSGAMLLVATIALLVAGPVRDGRASSRAAA
jgi:hypothetical protein